MKRILVSLVTLASAACSTHPRPADEPVAYVEPSAEAKDPPADPQPSAPIAEQTPLVDNESDGVGSNAHREREHDAVLHPSPAPDTSANGSAAPSVGPVAAAAPVNPDDTGVNKRDRNNSTLTPLDQSNKQTDLDITQSIRKAVIAKDGFSFNAKNVKIITVSGNVTLRGPVKSAAERETIANLARGTAGVVNVDDQLEVKP
jgi:hypothetical protein